MSVLSDKFSALKEPGIYAFYYDGKDGFGITFFDWYGEGDDDVIEAMRWWSDKCERLGIEDDALTAICWDDELEDQEYIDAQDWRNEEDWSEYLAGEPDVQD